VSDNRDLSTSSARQLKGWGAVVVDKSALPNRGFVGLESFVLILSSDSGPI